MLYFNRRRGGHLRKIKIFIIILEKNIDKKEQKKIKQMV